jgi:16S rRNA (cytosine1402-N4)-methyltransferase
MTLLMEAPVRHEPVLLQEVLAALAVRPGGRYIDCTVDGAGHAEAILEAASPGGSLLGLDADPEAAEMARRRLARFGDDVAIVNANFRSVDAVARERGFEPVNGVLFDLGLSSHQLAAASRGFSFRIAAPLDMRFGPEQETTASYWVNEAEEQALADLIWRFGEERDSRRIARAIVRSRPLRTTTDLAKAVEQAVGRRPGSQTHPATKTFQALRFFVIEYFWLIV